MPRPPQLSIVPCISCTSCGVEVPISRFGEHTCDLRDEAQSYSPSRSSRPPCVPATARLDGYPQVSGSQHSPAVIEDEQRSIYSSDYQLHRYASSSHSGSSRASSATFASSVGRSASNASSALSSVSAGSRSADGTSKSFDFIGIPPARTHARQFSASSTCVSSGQPAHSRDSSVSSLTIVSREDAMYRAHPSCMEDRVKTAKPAMPTGHPPGGLSRDGAIDQSKSGPAHSAEKRTCRGCDQTIVGKAIRDIQGRLSGHWHKPCFVCTRCLEPFTTAEFFVFNDKPYCERHYHELNGSLCSTCSQGIEGPCLETVQKQRFHPQCLKCTTCRVRLDAGYLDLDGRVFCERHGLATMQRRGQGLPSNLQRRTTRLLVV